MVCDNSSELSAGVGVNFLCLVRVAVEFLTLHTCGNVSVHSPCCQSFAQRGSK